MSLGIGRCAARASRWAGSGGQMIGGRVALVAYPGVLAELATDRRVVLVSGTNGKTTTTAMLTAALRTVGPVASNTSGANMLDGLTTVLANDRALTVVAEIDELYLPHAVTQTQAQAVVLLNLSRDQLDRAGEIRRIAARLRALAEHHPDLLMVANCDDPHVVYVASAFSRVVWVSAGTGWWGDTGGCPACGHHLRGEGTSWSCTSCGLRRPVADWRPAVGERGTAEGTKSDGQLVGPEGALVPLRLQVPGGFNRANAAMAIAAAHALSVPSEDAAHAIETVTEVAGRYRVWRMGPHTVRLILAKNPAGWAATLDMLCAQQTPVVISINAAEADGRDTSWLYDVEFERLVGHSVIAAGDRAPDLGVRLSYAGVAHGTTRDPLAALDDIDSGPVYLVGDYTSFSRVRARLTSKARPTRDAA